MAIADAFGPTDDERRCDLLADGATRRLLPTTFVAFSARERAGLAVTR